MKLNKVDKLFLTGAGAEEHAGLSGLVLTLSGLGSPVLEVFGPTGVDEVVVRLCSHGRLNSPRCELAHAYTNSGEVLMLHANSQ